MDTRWYYQAPDGSTGGPLPTAEVLSSLLEGRLPIDVQLCEEGSNNWSPPRDLPAFKLASKVVRASRGQAPAPQPAAPLPASQSLHRVPPPAPMPPPRAVPPPSRAVPPPVPPPRAMPAPMPVPMPPPAAAAANVPPPDDDDDEMATIVVTSAAGAAMRGYPGVPGAMPVSTVPGLPAPAPVPAARVAPAAAAAPPTKTPGFGQIDDEDDEEIKTRIATSPESDLDLPNAIGRAGMPSPLGPQPVAPPPRAAAPVPPPARAGVPAPPRRAPVQTLMGMPSPAGPPPAQPPAPIADDDDREDSIKTRVASPDEVPMVFKPPAPVSRVSSSDHDDDSEDLKTRVADELVAPKVVVSERPEPPPASTGTAPSFDGGLDASKRNWPAPKLIPPPPKKVTIDDGSGTDPGARITSPAMNALDPRQRATVRLQAMQPTMKLQPIKPPGPSKLLLVLVAGGAALAAFAVALVVVMLMKR